MWPDGSSRFGISCKGCGNGIDPAVVHEGGKVRITAEDGRTETVALEEWTAAVYRFADRAKRLYDESAPKNESADEFDRRGWSLFWAELNARRAGV